MVFRPIKKARKKVYFPISGLMEALGSKRTSIKIKKAIGSSTHAKRANLRSLRVTVPSMTACSGEQQ